MSNYTLKTMKKYTEQTHALDQERKILVEQLKDDSLPDNEVDSILKRLQDIASTQSSNAVILADMLASEISTPA